jgi:N-acetylmuramoyl-L-alanine amidase
MLLLSGLAHGEAQTAKQTTSACDRSSFHIIVDVGHTAEMPGAISARGTTEYDFNLRLARQIVQQLIAAGFNRTELLVTEGHAIRSLVHRVSRANVASGDLFLSIHHDAVPEHFLEEWTHEGQPHFFSDRFKGHSLFISHENAYRKASLDFARMFGLALKERALQFTPHYAEAIMGSRRRELVDSKAGVYRFDKLYVLRAANMPAVLFEAGVIKNRDEELLLASSEHRDLLVAAAVDATENFCALRARKSLPQSARR